MLAARAPEVGPDTALLFVEALETRRAYLGNITPLPALPGLLLAAETVDADAVGQRFLVDGWLLLRVADGAGPAVQFLVVIYASLFRPFSLVPSAATREKIRLHTPGAAPRIYSTLLVVFGRRSEGGGCVCNLHAAGSQGKGQC